MRCFDDEEDNDDEDEDDEEEEEDRSLSRLRLFGICSEFESF